MDLVDIDKVLDDLELNENKINSFASTRKARKSASEEKIVKVDNEGVGGSSGGGDANSITGIFSASNTSSSSIISQQKVEQSNQNDSYTIDNNRKLLTTAITKNTIDDSRNMKNKKFVTVSNVFSSLDDYRRDVESLKSKSHNTDDNNDKQINDTDLLETDNINKDLNILNSMDNIEYEAEDVACTIVTTSSSSSITTSSSSSFSSGPSPGSPGSGESCSLIVDHNKHINCNYKDKKVITDDEDGHIEEKYVNNMEIKNLDKQQQQEFEKQQRQKQFDSNNKESVEQGLSSISSYLYCENVSSSLPCSSQDMKFDALSSITSSQTQNIISGKDNYGDYDDEDDDDDEDDGDNSDASKNKNENQYKKNQRRLSSEDEYESGGGAGVSARSDNIQFQKLSSSPTHQQKQKVVGFGSTMDEISDTELDSILQEIDNDFQMHYASQPTISVGIACELPSKPTDCTDDADISKKPIVKEVAVISKNSASFVECEEQKNNSFSVKSTDEDNSGVGCYEKTGSNTQPYPVTPSSNEDENNLQNADSFSQASTIEFADLRLQTDFEVDTNDDVSITATGGNVASDQTNGSIDSSENDFNEKNTNSNENKHSKQNKDNKNEKSNNGNLNEQNEELTEKAVTCNTIQHLQRPNSLDLPTQMDVKMYINSTAGQTPPASRLDDISILSTSSSDDQQLSLTEQNDIIASSSSQNQQYQQNLIGIVPPFWIPDSEAAACMQCKQKFSLIKRRHHCRACGQVLCSVCCSQKAKLAFLGNTDARVCIQCFVILNEAKSSSENGEGNKNIASSSSSENRINAVAEHRSPNPNNPMEYCSMISPYQQVVQQPTTSPISVMVPVGVLKREGAPKSSRKDKTVIFSDGIRPGCDLTDLDKNWDLETDPNRNGQTNSNNSNVNNNSISNNNVTQKGDNNNSDFDNSGNAISNSRNNQLQQQQGLKKVQAPSVKTASRNLNNRNTKMCDETESYIPKEVNNLPPICISNKTESKYLDVQNNLQLIELLQREALKFAIQRNFFVYVKIVKLKCCVNKTIINFTTQGMHYVGQDEIIILLELDNSNLIPKDVFVHLNEIYKDAEHGLPISELGFSMPKQTNFLGSREHGGFLYIRPTFQCLQEIHLPESPYLIGILIHRWEVPWAKIFPLRLMLRLGAEYRYYPSPHISIRGRNSVYAEIAQTIINFLADFRNYSYTLTTIRGMYVHMEDRRTNILIPKNRYDQIIKALNNSSDHILALGANFSKKADGHLVCMQNMEADCPETHTYSTQAINIQGQARKVTGASFIVFNGALKTTSGLTGKCNIVEDGLMVQILPAKMQAVRNSLKNMKDIEIVCGPNDVDESQTEIVSVKWTENDTEFNIGVKSPIDGKKMDGIPSIRVHSGLNYSNKNHIIRWTEVFVIQYDEESSRNKDPIDISKTSEQIAKSTSVALVSFLDLLAANDCIKIGLRATLHQESVCYEAGSKNSKLPPLYMNALDNELIPILHKQATSLDIDHPIILELIFNILNK